MWCARLLTALAALCVVVVSVLASDRQAQADVGTWSSGGPPEAVSAVAVSPQNEQEALAAGQSGVWRTSNGGGTWSRIAGQRLGRALVLDPGVPSSVFGTSADMRTLLHSSDGGATWETVLSGPGSTQFYDVWADPLVPGRVLVAGTAQDGQAQVFRTADHGATWSAVLPPDLRGAGGIGQTAATTLAAPAVRDVIFAGVQVYHGGLVLRSTDGGATWSAVYTGGLTPLSAPVALSASGTALPSTTVYASFSITGAGSLIRSDDGGASWNNVSASLPLSGSRTATNVLAHPARPDWIYTSVINTAGSAGAFASADAGQTWQPVGQPGVRAVGLHGLVLALSSRTLWAATGEGVQQDTLAWPVAPRFDSYYEEHDGYRLLGTAISLETQVDGMLSQYYEKGRLEDHGAETSDPNWRAMYGLLIDELHEARATLPVGGDVSQLSYAGLHDLTAASLRQAPPSGYPGSGTFATDEGSVFVPFSADLSGAPGHPVPAVFWDYMSRGDLFPGGWLHDIGLPITEARQITVTKYLPDGPAQRTILVQAFQRTILTYDAENPLDWQVERANSGSDYRKAFPERAGP